MEQTLTFGEDCANKNKFHICELTISTDKVNITKIVLSNK